LATIADTGAIQRAANGVVTHAGKILDTPATYENN
jgi:hypothetical protein